jgi:PhzF family phenazine biosynthesis protein
MAKVRTVPTFLVEAFTDGPFTGNVAAVCLVDAPPDDGWMQAVAGELGVPETGFCRPLADGTFALRWFTPAAELALCGHGTLAAAHVLWEQGRVPPAAEISFRTRSGTLTAGSSGRLVRIELPANPPEPIPAPTGLEAALGARPIGVYRALTKYLVELESEAAVRDLRPDLGRIAELRVTGVVVTAAGSGDYDFVSRYFAPAIGVAEDPVTGSAHTILAPFWQRRLGRSRMRAYQASQRGGALTIELDGNTCALSGQAVTVLRGDLSLTPGRGDEVDDDEVRLTIIRSFVETGRPPQVRDLARQTGAPDAVTRRSLRRLADARHLVLDANDEILMAHPFSAVPLGFAVMGPKTLWWGGCAWDSFALPHLLPDAPDVLVSTRCPGCGAALAWVVQRDRPPAGEHVAHFLVPVAQIWEDVVHACRHQRLFCREECVHRWLTASGNQMGYIMDLSTLWRLASRWYTGRFEPGYQRRDPGNASAYFRSVDLHGSFWGL